MFELLKGHVSFTFMNDNSSHLLMSHSAGLFGPSYKIWSSSDYTLAVSLNLMHLPVSSLYWMSSSCMCETSVLPVVFDFYY